MRHARCIATVVTACLMAAAPAWAAAPEPEDTPVDEAPVDEAPADEAPAAPSPAVDDATARAMNRAKELRLRGQELAAQGLHDQALDVYRQALEAYPAYPLAHNEVGAVFVAQGQLARAEASFREALALDPGFTAARANLGEVLRRLGRSDEARVELERAAVEAPEDPGVYVALAAIYTQAGQKGQALWAMERYLEKAGAGASLLTEVQVRAAELIRAGVAPEAPALASAEDAPTDPVDPDAPIDEAPPMEVATAPGEPGALPRHAGDEAFYAQRYMAALEAYRAAFEKAPDDVVLMYKLGAVSAVMRDPRNAERWWRRALLADPGRELLYHHLGLLRLKTGGDAATDVDVPADPIAAARASLYAGRAAEALVYLADQPGVEPTILRAEGLLILGRHAEAKAQLEAALAEAPDDLDAKGALAEALLAMGQSGPGEAAMQDWLEGRSANPETFIVLRARERASRLVTPVDDLDE